MIEFTILGELVSMKNSKRYVTVKGRMMAIKSAKAIAYEKMAVLQIPAHAKQMLDYDLFIHVRCYYASERPDLDAELLYDILQAEMKNGEVIRKGVYLNDRQLRVKYAEHYIDKANPRVEVFIKPRNQAQLFTAN